MDKGKYVSLATKQLQKRKKYASILLVILIVAVMLNALALIYNIVIGKGFINTLFVSAAACIMIFIPIYIGKKKIEGELKNREDN
jgi:amino acid permease